MAAVRSLRYVRWACVALAATLTIAESFAASDAAPCKVEAGRVVSRQGTVEVRRQGVGDWLPAKLEMRLCDGDAVRTAPRSRAALFIRPENIVRLDQNTAISLRVTDEETIVDFFTNGQVAADPDCGAGYFISRFPRKFKVRTQHVSAEIDGTEFLVRAACVATTVAVYEGAVRTTELSTDRKVLLKALEQITVGPGYRDSIPIRIKPRDGVQWTIYYPLWTQPASSAASASDECPAGDTACLLQRAQDSLVHGLIAEARALIDPLAKSGDAHALALSSFLEIANDNLPDATANAKLATTLAPQNPIGWYALSYAQQAQLDLDSALGSALRAVATSPGDARLLARVSELHMTMGNSIAAHAAAREAIKQDPQSSRSWIALGFAYLGQLQLMDAQSAFSSAMSIDSEDPLSHLGTGLVHLRTNRIARGREELEIAVALDPTNSVLRSYLGMAYFDERKTARLELARTQLEQARRLDPHDPTPPLLLATLLQAANRAPVALEYLGESRAKNSFRAVYRSPTLLVDDESARTTYLAHAYREAGFSREAVLAAHSALWSSPSNAEGHRLLADLYLPEPQYAFARDSELLQAQLLQGASARPVQPRLATNGLVLANSGDTFPIGTNEYSALLGSRPIGLMADTALGTQGISYHNMVLYGLVHRTAYSVGTYGTHTNGYRSNNDLTQRISNAFVQHDLNPSLSIQAEHRRVTYDVGDRYLLYFDDHNFLPRYRERFFLEGQRFGARLQPASGHTLLFSASRTRIGNPGADPDQDFSFDVASHANQAELRYLTRTSHTDVDLGFSFQEGNSGVTTRAGPDTTFTPGSSRHSNAYLYTQTRLPQIYSTVQLGISHDRFDDGSISREQNNPKLGYVFSPTPSLTLRAASYRVLKRTMMTSQTLEPTAIVGFNQFFDDYNGTDYRGLGLAIDLRSQDLKSLLAVEFTRRSSILPPAIVFTNTSDDAQWTENRLRAIGAKVLTPQVTATASIEHQRHYRDVAANNDAAYSAIHIWRLPLELRWFSESALSTRIRVTTIVQSGTFANFSTGSIESAKSRFSVVDLGISYRLPDRRGMLFLDIRNAFDRRFQFQDIIPSEPEYPYRRALVARTVFWF